MKKLIFIALLAITSISTFGQTLSKEETIEYVKNKFINSASYYIDDCYQNSPLVETILDVRVTDGKLFIDTRHVKVFPNGSTGSAVVSTLNLRLNGNFVVLLTNDCGNRIYNIGGEKFSFRDQEDVKSLVKALNYLSTLCKDPFQ